MHPNKKRPFGYLKNVNLKPQYKIKTCSTCCQEVCVCLLDGMNVEKKMQKRSTEQKSIMLHKFRVSLDGISYSKDRICDIILENVGHTNFIPDSVIFTNSIPKYCTFKAINCSDALQALRKKNMVCQPVDGGKSVALKWVEVAAINVGVAVYIEKINLALANKRKGNVLSLENFHTSCELDYFYFPLSHSMNQKIIRDLLITSQYSSITSLILSGNKLKNLEELDIANVFKYVKSLNLSNNLIKKISLLCCLRGLALTELWLEGNPLCINYISASEYLDTVRLIFPQLSLLDGEEVSTGMPIAVPNYLHETDGQVLINRFLEMYFSLFDGSDRQPLDGMYHEHAIFTLTCASTLVFETSQNLGKFINRSRNLLKMERTFKKGNVISNAHGIVKYLCSLPVTTHDPFSFTVDVPTFEDFFVVIFITGVFKLPSGDLAKEEPVIEFARTFVLVRDENYKYTIINDMLNLARPTEDRIIGAFKVTNLTGPEPSIEPDGPLSPKIQERIVNLFKTMTSLETSMAERCLRKFNWKFKDALEHFLILEKRDQISSLNVPEENTLQTSI